MQNTPLVSILIPTFNQNLGDLKECVDSALQQTYANIEVVVSDNHSTNGAGELLASYRDPRLRIVRPPAFVPMNENFDFCASHAAGDYLSFLSSDDAMRPHCVERLVALMQANPAVAFACGNIVYARRFADDPRSRRDLIRPPGSGDRVLAAEQASAFFFPWQLASTWMAGDLIRRGAYQSTGGLARCTLNISGDVWLTRQLLAQGGFAYADEPLALFRMRAIGHQEVDPNRRLLEFADGIVLQGQAPAALRRLRQHVVLAYRLGATPAPSDVALATAAATFRDCGRHDLARQVERSRTHRAVFGALHRFLAGVKLARDLGVRVVRRLM